MTSAAEQRATTLTMATLLGVGPLMVIVVPLYAFAAFGSVAITGVVTHESRVAAAFGGLEIAGIVSLGFVAAIPTSEWLAAIILRRKCK